MTEKTSNEPQSSPDPAPLSEREEAALAKLLPFVRLLARIVAREEFAKAKTNPAVPGQTGASRRPEDYQQSPTICGSGRAKRGHGHPGSEKLR
ncbi:hypothetical protein [Falsiroseomonas sp. HW251]|uniref:hypothetical protein n=1 Tax=Falsiroseomonas sp. HW251 TaxID=3390998 RepID=UPI003D31599F